MNITTFEKETKEYKALEVIASQLEMFSKKGYKYEVKDVYFDFGQKMMWTTIVCTDKTDNGITGHWQILSPRQYEMIVTAQASEDLCVAYDDIRNGKYFRDK